MNCTFRIFICPRSHADHRYQDKLSEETSRTMHFLMMHYKYKASWIWWIQTEKIQSMKIVCMMVEEKWHQEEQEYHRVNGSRVLKEKIAQEAWMECYALHSSDTTKKLEMPSESVWCRQRSATGFQSIINSMEYTEVNTQKLKYILTFANQWPCWLRFCGGHQRTGMRTLISKTR